MNGRLLLDTNIVIGLIAQDASVRERLAEAIEVFVNDIWIAAIAQQYQLTLVSRDEHFNEVEGLPVEMW